MRPASLSKVLATLATILALSVAAAAQTTTRPSRITRPVDDNDLVELKGNTHPLARPQFDRGPAPADLPMNRMLLLLSHTKEQEAGANRLIEDQQNANSPNFHKWLTPEQYGEQFGPTPEEIQTVTYWLQQHGFSVAHVAKGRHVIEFSGTAAQVQEALHTSIHKFAVKGEDHWANASNPKIPSALAPIVAGVVSLHNFPRKPQGHTVVARADSATTGPISTRASRPASTFASSGCNADGYCFGISPYDFATIYNVKQLWDEGIDGAGQSIAVVARSNINLQDVRNYRNLFHLPPNDPLIILNGPDPGILSATGDETENLADTTYAGVAAKNAIIKMVVSSITNTTDGADLSSQYIVDNNLASTMTESYAFCEMLLGTAGNQFEYTLRQQAAAQGITDIVVASDGGSADCDFDITGYQVIANAQLGFSVNGLASTPYDVAVGGTDLNLFSNPFKYWSLANDPTTQASALSYIPETTWNDNCANRIFVTLGLLDVIANCNNPNLANTLNIPGFLLSPSLDYVFGSGAGGASSCTISDGLNLSSCQGGYPKPSWQKGPGVPSDGRRDIPDVSLFASGGFLTGAFYLLCEADVVPNGACSFQAPYFNNIATFEGTSAAGPFFAGIMALVNQKTQSRQGNANYVFYKLAAEQPTEDCNSSTGPASSCIFNDITFGGNRVPCAAGTPNCLTEGSLPIGVLSGYDAGVGYDLATGLGSVNAYNLVHKWKSVTLDPTNTYLTLNPRSVVHGHPVGVNIDVTSKEGTPTGQVSLLASSSPFTLNNQSDGDFTLNSNGGISSTTETLPGGYYTLRAHYGGDGIFGQSDSEPVALTVYPESSTTFVSTFLCGASLTDCGYAAPFGIPFGVSYGTPFSSAPYGTFIFVRADVAGKSGFGVATGLINFSDDAHPLIGDPYSLNSQGNTANPNGIATFAPGLHKIRASYSGDSSFLPSDSKPVTFMITKAPTQTVLLSSSATAAEETSLTLTATVSTTSYGNPPTGKIAFFAGSKLLAPPVAVTGGVDPIAGTAVATATIATTRLPVGQDNVTAKYIGDESYVGSISALVEITVTEQ